MQTASDIQGRATKPTKFFSSALRSITQGRIIAGLSTMDKIRMQFMNNAGGKTAAYRYGAGFVWSVLSYEL